jgi:TonB family C-terminal domain
MWDETLIESRKAKRKSWFTLPVAFFAHGLVVFIVIGASYWSIGAIPAPVVPPPSHIGVFLTSQLHAGSSLARAAKRSTYATPQVPNEGPPVAIPVPMQSNLNWQDAAPSTNTVVDAGGGTSDAPGTGTGNGLGLGTGNGISASGSDADHLVDITAEIRQPVLTHKVEPVYPALAIKSHIQGYVVLEAVVGKEGKVGKIKVLRSPNSLLTAAAIDAVQRWLYKPAVLNGHPISVYFTVTVKFELK